MNKSDTLFRKKSMERLSSPELLNDYLHVTGPAIWAVLLAVIFLLAGLFIWSGYTSVESYLSGTGRAESGVLTIYLDGDTDIPVETGMKVTVGSSETLITSVGKDDNGNVVASAETGLPDGEYDVKVSYKQTQILSLLFN